jgi:hypothetical protein
MPGEIISERRARSNRNGGRHHRGFAGDFPRNPQPEVVSRLKSVLERFADALSCIDQCFIADEMLEHLPVASQVGKTTVNSFFRSPKEISPVASVPYT